MVAEVNVMLVDSLVVYQDVRVQVFKRVGFGGLGEYFDNKFFFLAALTTGFLTEYLFDEHFTDHGGFAAPRRAHKSEGNAILGLRSLKSGLSIDDDICEGSDSTIFVGSGSGRLLGVIFFLFRFGGATRRGWFIDITGGTYTLIGIRTESLPDVLHMLIGGRPVLRWVLEGATDSQHCM